MIKPDSRSPHMLLKCHSDSFRQDEELDELHPFLVTSLTFETCDSITYAMPLAMEMGIVLEGKIRRFYGRDYTRDYHAGQIWFSGIGDLIACKTIQTPCVSVVLHILPDALAGMQFREALHLNFMSPFLADPKDRPEMPENTGSRIQELGRKLVQIHGRKSDCRQLWYRHTAQEILMIVLEVWKPPVDRKSKPSACFSKIHPAINLVFGGRRCIHEQEAARACRLSVSSLNKHFRSITGMTFADFSLRYRIHGVAGELLTSDKPIKEIAFDWGFHYVSNMDRCFTKRFGVSPGQYRSHQKERKPPA